MLKFNDEEERASDHLIAFMDQVHEWGLVCNSQEMTQAIHILQLFLIKHMLQRLDAEGFSDWYDPIT